MDLRLGSPPDWRGFVTAAIVLSFDTNDTASIHGFWPRLHQLLVAMSRSTNERARAFTFILLLLCCNALSSTGGDVKFIKDRRSLVVSDGDASCPPLIVLGGMAQSIQTWSHQLSALSRGSGRRGRGSGRRVFMYEPLGTGKRPETLSTPPQTYFQDVSIMTQGKDFWDVVDAAFPDSEVVDVAGFSFGGRIGMAASVLQPGRIRGLHLTGVGAERDALADVLVKSWRDILGAWPDHSSWSEDTSRLRAFAWGVILATYSEQALSSAGHERIQTWVKSVCENNTEEGLRAILDQTHDVDGEWTPLTMAPRISSRTRVKVVVGSDDKISPPHQAERLAVILNGSAESSNFEVLKHCGHAAPMEAARAWRNDVLEFFARGNLC